MFPEHGRDVETLMQRADIAMYSAKARGVGHEVYSALRDGHSRARLALIGELPDAIRVEPGGRLLPAEVRPRDRRGRRRRGARALGPPAVRPASARAPFLPLAEQTGLMRPLHACAVLNDALAGSTPSGATRA